MIPVLPLQKLAAQKTVDNFLNLGWKVPYPIDTGATNAIINVFPKDSRTTFIRQNYQNLKIRKVDFLREKNVKEDIRMLRSFVLDSLILGDISLDGFYGFPVDIVVLLKDVLNEKSRQILCHLNVGTGMEFRPNWLENVLELVPNLKSLAIQNKNSPYLPDFFKLSNTFELVRILDLSYITIASLEGISNFPNLENLILHNTRIDKSEESMREISKLKRLVELDISRFSTVSEEEEEDPPTYLEKAFVTFCDSLPELRLIDCCGTEIENGDIQRIWEIAPKLEKIALYLNYDYDHDLLRDDPRCMDSFDLPSTIQLYRYFESKNKIDQMSYCLHEICDLAESECTEKEDCLILHEFLHFMCELFDNSVGGKRYLANCILFYCQNFKQFLNNQEKFKLASTLIRAIPRIQNGRYTKEVKGTCWSVIHDLQIISMPGASDIRKALLVSIFQEHVVTKATIRLLGILVETEKVSQVFKDDRNHGFWISKSIRLLDYAEPRFNRWSCLAIYRVFICISKLLSYLLEDCKIEVDIRYVMRMISLLKNFDHYEEQSHEAAMIIKSMILLIDRKKFRPQDQTTSLLNSVYRHFTKKNWTHVWSDEKSAELEILKYAIASMTDGEIEEVRTYLNLEICNYIATENSINDRIIESEGNVTKNIEAPADTAKRKVEEILKDARALRVAIEVNGKGRRNLFGEALEKNYFKNHRVRDVVHNY